MEVVEFSDRSIKVMKIQGIGEREFVIPWGSEKLKLILWVSGSGTGEFWEAFVTDLKSI